MLKLYERNPCPHWYLFVFESHDVGCNFLELLTDHFDVDVRNLVLDEENFDWVIRVPRWAVDFSELETVMQLQAWQRVDCLWAQGASNEDYSLRA